MIDCDGGIGAGIEQHSYRTRMSLTGSGMKRCSAELRYSIGVEPAVKE